MVAALESDPVVVRIFSDLAPLSPQSLPPSRDLLLLLLELNLEGAWREASLEAQSILQLGRSSHGAENTDAGGFVQEVDGRLNLVHVLAARAADE